MTIFSISSPNYFKKFPSKLVSFQAKHRFETQTTALITIQSRLKLRRDCLLTTCAMFTCDLDVCATHYLIAIMADFVLGTELHC
eukprot:SAG31_NODE_10130_length_1179_cov_1.661972_2_plen_84_part_00